MSKRWMQTLAYGVAALVSAAPAFAADTVKLGVAGAHSGELASYGQPSLNAAILVVDEFNAQCEGDDVEIGFNNRYLLDALRNARTEQVRLEISGPLSPVKVLPAEGSDFLYLVLPVRFKND